MKHYLQYIAPAFFALLIVFLLTKIDFYTQPESYANDYTAQVKEYIQNDENGEFSNYVDFLIASKNEFTELTKYETFVTLKLLKKMNQLTEENIKQFLK
jgi:carboxypeptidase C (cathepsin A)